MIHKKKQIRLHFCKNGFFFQEIENALKLVKKEKKKEIVKIVRDE